MANTVKNGKYGDAENARLSAYSHPNYGPNLSKPPGSYSSSETKDKLDNQQAGSWRYPVASEDE